MDFFYLVTGFTLGYAYDGRKEEISPLNFLKKRFLKFQPLVILTAFIPILFFKYLNCPLEYYKNLKNATFKQIMIDYFMQIFNIPIPDKLKYSPNGSFFPINPPQWTLEFEYIANIVYIFFLRHLTTKVIFTLMIIFELLVIYLIFSSETGRIYGGFTFFEFYEAIFGLIRMFNSILIGQYIARIKKEKLLKEEIKNKKKINNVTRKGISHAFILSSLILIAVGNVPYLGTKKERIWINSVFESFSLLVILPLILIITINEKSVSEREKYIFEWTGRVSFPLYLSHFIFIDFTNCLVENNGYSFNYMINYFIGIIVLGVAYAHLLDEVYYEPIQKWIKSHVNENFFKQKKANI